MDCASWVQNALTNQAIRDAKVQLYYKFSDKLKGAVSIENSAKIPDLSYSLFQSSYVNYNWYHSFTTEKSTDFKFSTESKWINLKAQFSNYKDKVFLPIPARMIPYKY